MEEEFEVIEVEVDASMCCGEIDFDYEFDAPRFFDFTRPETFWDAFEAEQWFEYASSYPPSPFLLKFNLGNACAMKNMNVSADDSGHCMETEEVSAIDDNNNTVEDSLNGKTKHLSKLSKSISKISRFMKPTASHLAKHKKPKEVDLADNNVVSKSKGTIPREPNLEAASRAQRHKSRTNAESGGDTKSSSQKLKARPLNKKILEAPTQPSHKKKKTLRLTEFNVFHFRTSERAMQHTSSNAGGISNSSSISNGETKDLKRTNSSDRSRQEKYKMINKLRGSSNDKQLSSKVERGVFRNIKVFPLEQNDKRILNEPPTELFSKLSPASEAKQATKSQSKKLPVSKGLKENRPGSFRQEHEKMNMIKEGIQRLCRKQYQCVNEIGSLVSKHTCMLELGH